MQYGPAPAPVGRNTFVRVEAPNLVAYGIHFITLVDARDFSHRREFSIVTYQDADQSKIRNGTLGNSTLGYNTLVNSTLVNSSLGNSTLGSSVLENSTLVSRSSYTSGLLGYTPNWDGYGDGPTGPCPNKKLGSDYVSGQYVTHSSLSCRSDPISSLLFCSEIMLPGKSHV